MTHLNVVTEEMYTLRATGLWVDELSDNSIHSLFVDTHGSLWAGTYYGGVNHFDPAYDRFRTYVRTGSLNSLGADIVSSFAEDDQGVLYVGTEGGGLTVFSADRKGITHYKPDPKDKRSLSGPNVKSLLLDGNQLWVGTFKDGLNRLDLAKSTFSHYQAGLQEEDTKSLASSRLANNNVYGLAKFGKYLWTATYGGGLSLLDTSADTFINFRHDPTDENSIISNQLRTIYNKSDQFWIGTEAGMQRVLVNDDGLPVRFENVFTDTRVHAIYQDDEGYLWAGTLSKGLYKLSSDGDIVRHFTTVDGLSGNTVFGILGDENGYLWLSTNEGLSRFII